MILDIAKFIYKLDENKYDKKSANNVSGVHLRKSNKAKRSWLTIYTIFTLNLWALYLFIDFLYLIFVPLLFTAINVLLLIGKFISIRKKKKKLSKYDTQESSIADMIKLSIKHITISRTSVLLGIYGIVLATIIISQSFLLANTYTQLTFDNYFSEGLPPAARIHFNAIDQAEFYDTVNDLEKKTIEEFNNEGLEYGHMEYRTEFYTNYIDPFNSWQDGNVTRFNTINTKLFTMNEELYAKLTEFPTFDNDSIPFDSNAVYLFLPYYFNEYNPDLVNNLNKNKRILIPINDPKTNNDGYMDNVTLDVDFLWIISQNDKQYGYQYFSNDNPLDIIDDSSIGINKTYYDDITEEILSNKLENNNEYGYWYNNRMVGIVDYYAIINEVGEDELYDLSSRLTRLETQMRTIANEYRVDNNYVRAYSPLLRLIWNYQGYTVTMKSTLLLVALPVIGLAIFLVYFSLSLLEQRRKRVLAIMKGRGTSSAQSRALLISEIITSTVIALSSGMILSVPWAIYLMNVTGIIESDFLIGALSIPVDWYWKLPIMGIILSIDLNVSSIKSLSTITIDEGGDAIQRKKPLWQRFYIDLVLFSLSSTIWIIVRFLPFGNGFLIGLFVYGFGPPALFLLLITAPLVVARYFGGFVNKLSVILWQINGGLTALATRNLSKNRNTSSKLVALLVMGIMLSMLALIIPYTFEIHSVEEARYDLGADIKITGLDPYNQSLMDALKIDGVQATTEIVKSTIANQDGRGFSSNYIESYTFIGMNISTFSSAAYWEEDYAEYSLNDIVSTLNENNSVALQSDELYGSGLSGLKNPAFTVKYTENSSQVLYVRSTFKYFPNLVSQLPSSDWNTGRLYIDKFTILAQFDIVEKMGNYTDSVNYEIYVKVHQNANVTLVSENLKSVLANETSIRVVNFKDYQNIFFASQEAVIVLSLLKGMIQIAFITSIIGVTYFSFLTLSERKREIGVFRAMGMITKQIFKLLLMEVLLLLFSGIIFGFLIGIFLSSSFAYMFKIDSVYNPPPFRLYIPMGPTYGLIMSITIVTVIVAAIPAFIISFKQTGSILRTD